MNRFNKETLTKLVILIISCIFYIRFFNTGDISKFMHPRLIPFVKFSVILMIVISLSLIVNLRKDKARPSNLRGYKLFIIPLLVVLFLDPAKDLANMQLKDTKHLNNNNEQNNNNENLLLNSEEIKENNDEDKNESIIITDDNYLSTLDKIYAHKDNYIGRKITVKGFIYKDESLAENSYVIARYVMSCCASDMQIVGFMCKDNKMYQENSWHEITGTLRKADNSDSLQSIYIEVENSKDIAIPANEYIYP